MTVWGHLPRVSIFSFRSDSRTSENPMGLKVLLLPRETTGQIDLRTSRQRYLSSLNKTKKRHVLRVNLFWKRLKKLLDRQTCRTWIKMVIWKKFWKTSSRKLSLSKLHMLTSQVTFITNTLTISEWNQSKRKQGKEGEKIKWRGLLWSVV